MSHKLKILLEDILTAEENQLVSSSYDMIGDTIILKIPERLLYKKYSIGKRVLENIKNVKSVFLQTSPVEGEYRIRKLELLAGDSKTVTEYREHGCRFIVDLSKVYFSPRLSTERLRIAKKIEDNEVIAN